MRSSAATSDREQIREYVLAEMSELRRVLTLNVERARAELVKHMGELRMVPCGTRNHRYYEAQSTVRFGADLRLPAEISRERGESSEVIEKEKDHAVLAQRDPGYFQMVAGGGLEPPTFGL